MINLAQDGPRYPELLRGFVPPPQSGAHFHTLATDAKMLGMVLLSPGDGLSNAHRRMAEAHPYVECSVLGDVEGVGPAPLPRQFHQSTLRWMIDRADKLAIWSAPHSQRSEDVEAWWSIRVHFGTLVETNEDRALEWVAFLNRWKRPTCSVELFSGLVGGIQ